MAWLRQLGSRASRLWIVDQLLSTRPEINRKSKHHERQNYPEFVNEILGFRSFDGEGREYQLDEYVMAIVKQNTSPETS